MAPEIAKAQTSMISKQCTAHWTPSDFPWLICAAFFNDVRWPEKSGEVRGKLRGPQEDIDFREQKKTPKQAGGRVGKQENTQRKAPGSSAR